jgi:hypothetical protein
MVLSSGWAGTADEDTAPEGVAATAAITAAAAPRICKCLQQKDLICTSDQGPVALDPFAAARV